MEDVILKELQELKNLTLLSSKKALNLNDLYLLTGISKSTLYKMVSAKTLPYYKHNGKLLYFDKDEINAYLLQNRIKTNEEVEQEAATYCTKNRK